VPVTNKNIAENTLLPRKGSSMGDSASITYFLDRFGAIALNQSQQVVFGER